LKLANSSHLKCIWRPRCLLYLRRKHLWRQKVGP